MTLEEALQRIEQLEAALREIANDSPLVAMSRGAVHLQAMARAALESGHSESLDEGRS